MRCDRVARSLPALADPEARLGPGDQAHVDRCLRCQARVAQYRRLSRALTGMRAEVVDPGSGLAVEVVARLADIGHQGVVEGSRRGRRVVYLGGIAAATAAGAAGAIVLASRSRRGPFRLAS